MEIPAAPNVCETKREKKQKQIPKQHCQKMDKYTGGLFTVLNESQTPTPLPYKGQPQGPFPLLNAWSALSPLKPRALQKPPRAAVLRQPLGHGEAQTLSPLPCPIPRNTSPARTPPTSPRRGAPPSTGLLGLCSARKTFPPHFPAVIKGPFPGASPRPPRPSLQTDPHEARPGPGVIVSFPSPTHPRLSPAPSLLPRPPCASRAARPLPIHPGAAPGRPVSNPSAPALGQGANEGLTEGHLAGLAQLGVMRLLHLLVG